MTFRLFNGPRLRELRELHVGSQGQLAALVGVSTHTVNRWETGKSQPRSTHFVRLAKVLQCDPYELIVSQQPESS